MGRSEKHYDIAVIGGGPGGYVAAIRAAQGKKSVALIEKGKMGGTCLNRGCIPTKALLSGADVLHTVKKAHEFGVIASNIGVDYAKMHTRSFETVAKIRTSLQGLVKANGIDVIGGQGKLLGPHDISIAMKGKDLASPTKIISADRIILATGSEPRNIGAFPFDGDRILCSTMALQMTSLPKSLCIIGGGVIGCEFASLFAELGVKVLIFEALDRIVATECKNISAALTKSFRDRGIEIQCGISVASIEKKNTLCIHTSDGKTFETEKALVAVGRSLNTDDLGLETVGIGVRPNGVIDVNSSLQTAVPHIYAIGDITGKAMLAHVASHQGLVAADHALGAHVHMHYESVPSVIFTHPEIASVGSSVERALAEGFKAKLSSFPFQVLGKAQASMQTDGFCQVVVESGTGRILGAQVIGHDASNLIAEMALAIANELTIECVSETIHAHPTIAESWMELASLALNKPVHMPIQRQV